MRYLIRKLLDFSLAAFFLRYGWVFVFFICCYGFYEQGLRLRNLDYDKLHNQHSQLENEKKRALIVQEDLILQINSQKDPEWVELTLKKVLGLVAQDETKFYFGNY